MKKFIAIFFLIHTQNIFSQISTYIDSAAKNKWSDHFQLTVISQIHSGFKSPYRGMNSLADTVEPAATSLTTTLFIGRKLWKGASFYFDPEVSGGNGLSFASGMAGALNGETYRVGATYPQVFIARAYLQQHIALRNSKYEYSPDDMNHVAEKIPTDRITISIGKFAISDFFDDNVYSKDPRMQFFNWSLWANGAWDYPANTRGYTSGLIIELVKHEWSIRFSSVAVPRIANASEMEYRFGKAHSETLETERKIAINKRPGAVSLIFYRTRCKSPSYKEGLSAITNNNNFILDVIKGDAEGNSYTGKKLGAGISFEQSLSDDLGIFSRAGWNDGRYVSWAFTEIDQTFSVGFSIKGVKWKRHDDVLGIASVINGISKDHQDFLKAGGYGFIIGDGRMNYGHENITELFYNAKLLNFFWVTADYQFVIHPAYNRDRGPVHVFALRGHIEF